MITVNDLMCRDLVTVGETDALRTIEDLLRRNRIRHLPVVRGHKLVGLVTHRDFLRALERERERPQGQGEPIWVTDFMTTELKTVRPETPAREAVRTLLDNKIGCLPVVDEAGRLAGILTDSDLVRYAGQVIDAEDRRSLAAEYEADA
jgi:CBS domain-containing protein